VLTLQGCTIRNNLAVGGQGQDGYRHVYYEPGSFTPYAHPGAAGGDAFGGGLYIGGGTAAIRSSTITANSAQGGAGGDGYHSGKLHSKAGPNGNSIGGGMYVNAPASAGLDAFTVKNIVRNSASSSKNIFGSYETIV
jgi:hypothetical protein